MNQYEGMFLLDPTFGASWESCEAEVRRILGRAEAEVVFCQKWDERRLAYKVKGRKRGVYVLTYFKASPTKIVGIERDVQLSENVLRVLVLRADDITPDRMEKALVHAKERPAESEGDGYQSRGPRSGGDDGGYAPRGGGDFGARRGGGPRGPRREEAPAESAFE